jgi:hypothetical protein
MSIGEGIGQGLNALAGQILTRKRAKEEQAQALEMFNVKQAAELDQLQKMETLKDDLATKRRDKSLELLRSKYGNDNPEGAVSLNTSPKLLEQNPNTQSLSSQSPQQAPTLAMFNPKAWQQQHFEDYIDNEKGSFDEKGFRKGAEDAQKENATLQYLRANGLDNLPDGVNLGTVSPFIGNMLGEKKETKKLEQNKSYVTNYANRNNLKLTPEEVEAYASRPGAIEAIISNQEQERRFKASESHAAKRESNADARLSKALAKGGGGGRGGSSGGGMQYIEDPQTGEVLTVKTGKNGQKSFGKSNLTTAQLGLLRGGGKPKPAPTFNYSPNITR